MPSYAAVFQLWFIDFLFRYCFYLLFFWGGGGLCMLANTPVDIHSLRKQPTFCDADLL